jgi:hypothetical protein
MNGAFSPNAIECSELGSEKDRYESSRCFASEPLIAMRERNDAKIDSSECHTLRNVGCNSNGFLSEDAKFMRFRDQVRKEI